MLTSVKLLWFAINPPKVDRETIDILESNSVYYKSLIPIEKKRFEKRLTLLLKFIRFESPKGMFISKKMKTIIAGGAVQLTFGLRRYILRHFKTISIQPGLYHIPELQDKLLGHVDKSKKSITLSWPNTAYGFEISDDAHNVAFHEMAHVLLFENTLRLRFEEFFSRPNWDNWLFHAEERFKLNQNRKNLLLSEYADKNLMEMFSVSIETFFEKAEEFKTTLPELYQSLCFLLKQDPTNPSNPRGLVI